MVTVETEKGTLYVDGRFSYTKQNADIADVSTSNTNYTNSFNVRRDKTSTRILKGLGLVGSLSRIPYEKTKARLNVNGVTIVENGWISIKSVDKDKYKISILDGNIDFWKAVEKVNLGQLDLHETEHKKSPQTIIESFDNEYYKYLIADYNGESFPDNDQYNGDQLIPSIKESYLFERLFEALGFSYSLPISIDTWLTYSKNTGGDAGFDDATIYRLDSDQIDSGRFDADRGFLTSDMQPVQSDEVVHIANTIGTRLYYFKIGHYKMTISWDKLRGYARIKNRSVLSQFFGVFTPVIIEIYINNTLHYMVPATITEMENFEIEFFPNFEISTYDVIDIRVRGLDTREYLVVHGNTPSTIDYKYFEAEEFIFKMERRNSDDLNFSDALENVSAKDYIKLIMHRYGLTLFYEPGDLHNNVKFMTIEDRINAPYQDLSAYYIARDSEEYVYGDYAQHNRFKHKYDQDGQVFNDSQIAIDNENLPYERQIVESFTYSATQNKVFKMYDKEISNNENDVIEIDYNPIDNRSFIQNINWKNVDDLLIYSKLPGITGENYSGAVPFATDQKSTFRYFIPKYWVGYENILNNAKIHKVILRMSIYKFMHIDLKKRVYIKAQASYYIINSIQVKNDDKVEAELIKLNYNDTVHPIPGTSGSRGGRDRRN